MSPAPLPELASYSPDSTLTTPQHFVLALLVEGESIGSAARQAGIHRNTIANWRRSVPAFAREMEFAIREQALLWHEQSIERAPKAIRILDEILDNPNASPALRLRAALAVLKTAAEVKAQPLRDIVHATVDLEAAHNLIIARKQEAAEVVHKPATQNHAQSCTTAPIRKAPEPGRNSTCPCNSGQKYKRCCGSNLPSRDAIEYSEKPH